MKSIFSVIPAILCLCFVSCKEDKGAKLIGKWQEVAVINPQLDETMHEQGVFADTVGSSTDAIQNKRLYGTDNIDSFKANAKANLDSFRKQQNLAIRSTIFEFRRDSLILIHSSEGVDSSRWYVDEDGALMLDEERLKGTGGKIKMDILEISDTSLKLQYKEKYLTSTAVFKPVKK